MAHSHFSFGSESFNKLEKHNIAIHLSRRPYALFTRETSLRPGDGERSPQQY
jgi:hypothetical protein